MRSSLSCDACRKSKIRCSHNGHSPCDRCGKSGIPDCRLTHPKAMQNKRASGHNKEGRTRKVNRTQRRPATENAHNNSEDGNEEPRAQVAQVAQGATAGASDVSAHLQQLPLGIVLKASSMFTRNYPELQLLHPVVFERLFQSHEERTVDRRALLAAILAAVKKQECYVTAGWMHSLLTSEAYANYACETLAACMLQRPNVVVAQAHLILTMYEWGVRDFQKAWIHCGIAVRIMQSVHSLRTAPVPLDDTEPGKDEDNLARATDSATFWACFILDCTINAGTYNPRMLSLSEMRKIGVPRPVSARSFLFGQMNNSVVEGARILGLDDTTEILIELFSIYADVMGFVYRDGRRAVGMCSPEQCPWHPDSFWAGCASKLDEWRSRLDPALLYPQQNVGSHANTGVGHSFVYLNLLYYQCIMMLYREYYPFLPKPGAPHTGPTDPPFLESEAPAGWWDESSRVLWGAARHTSTLLRQASNWGLVMMTPIPAFCGFTACYLNLYAAHFPAMTAGHATGAEELFREDLAFLTEFGKSWELAEGWIKTLQNATVLFEQVNAGDTPISGASRLDFEVLHYSAHDFRTSDRSAQYMTALRQAQVKFLGATSNPQQEQEISLDAPAADFDADVCFNFAADQILWPLWQNNIVDSVGPNFWPENATSSAAGS